MHRDQFVDTWRFVAVAAVITSHVALKYPTLNSLGRIGVFVFFFISGFVVSKAALKESRETGTFSVKGFYVRRAFRIIPPLAFYLLSCAVLGNVGLIQFDVRQAVLSAMYICNISAFDCGWYAGHTWSLAFEEQFYLLFPVAFLCLLRGRLTLWLPLVLPLLIAPLLYPLHFVGRSGFAVVYALFTLGFACAHFEHRWKRLRRANLMFLIGFTLTFFPVPVLGDDSLCRWHKYVYVVSIPLMVMATGCASFSYRAALALRPITFVGQASYSIYLWQQLFTGESYVDMPLPVHLMLLAGVATACVASFVYVERPLIAVGRQISRKAPPVLRPA